MSLYKRLRARYPWQTSSQARPVFYLAHDFFVCWQKLNDIRATSSSVQTVHYTASGVCMMYSDRFNLCGNSMRLSCCLLRKTMCHMIAVVCVNCSVQITRRMYMILACTDLQIFKKLVDFTKLTTFYQLYWIHQFFLGQWLQNCSISSFNRFTEFLIEVAQPPVLELVAKDQQSISTLLTFSWSSTRITIYEGLRNICRAF